MEYADSGALSDLIEKKQKAGKLFDIETLMQLFTQLATGINEINKVLVHRDIKPENILICGDILKISDFGLSKFSGENTRTLTFKGYGTAKYVAPEAWDNNKNTIQMDIYSMGIVFYELATLQYPYDTGGKQDIMAYRNAHLYQPAKNPASINSQLPPNIASVIIRMLEKPTQKRFTNWANILVSLQAEPTPKDNIHSFVETALKTRNAADIRLQEKLTEEKRLVQLKEDFCRLIYSQYDSTVIEPIRDFISRFNSQYAGMSPYKLAPETGNFSGERFSSTIITPSSKCYGINHTIKYECLAKLEEEMVYRILMTNNHTWGICEIIQAYHGQSFTENTFKNMKNQQHLSFNPQYHWTDQKIKVHNFCCVIAYLMTSLIYKTAREKGFTGSIDTLLDLLGTIRLGTIIKVTGEKANRKLSISSKRWSLPKEY